MSSDAVDHDQELIGNGLARPRVLGGWEGLVEFAADWDDLPVEIAEAFAG